MPLVRKVEKDRELPPSEPMVEGEKQKADAALDAVTALAQVVLTSSRRTRFSEAARICEIAQSLVKTTSRRVADQSEDSGLKLCMNRDIDEHSIDGSLVAYGYQRPLDENQIIRDVLLGMSKASTEQQKLAGIAESEAKELHTLVELLRTASDKDKETIELRVKRLMYNMEVRNAVVPADDTRRHSTRGSGGEDDRSSNGAHASRGGGDGEASDQSAPTWLGPKAVG